MAFFSSKDDGSKRNGGKVVMTGKRIQGTWVMESNLAPNARCSRRTDVALETPDRRVRMLKQVADQTVVDHAIVDETAVAGDFAAEAIGQAA